MSDEAELRQFGSDGVRLATSVPALAPERRRPVRIVPLTLKAANEYVEREHRHHKRVLSHRFSIGAVIDGRLVGAAIVGRPVARGTNQYGVAEVTRLVTDGSYNACSALYAAAARAARAMGFEKIQTFILEEEPGTSLKASGWEFESTSDGGSWDTPTRQARRVVNPTGPKQKWSKDLNPPIGDTPWVVRG